DPLTGEPFRDANGAITNIIPASRINKNAQNLVSKYVPLPQFSPVDPLDINTIINVPNILAQNQYFARLDHQFGPVDSIFVRYATHVSSYVVKNSNPNCSNSQHIHYYNVEILLLHSIAPSLLNEFLALFNNVNSY